MKFPSTFLTALAVAALLLFACAWFPRFLELAVMIGIMTCLFGGFVAFAIVVGMEFRGRRKLRLGRFVAVGVILAMLALTFVFDIFPYLWCGAAGLLLAVCLIWQGARDYLEMFAPRERPPAPTDWHTLESGQLPVTNSEHAKERFRQSYELQIEVRPRTGALGASTNPLQKDE